ncbi:response regulator [candidate division KSB1 bacterium]|nr:response regulator [candidate division KSB1 bacterium]
MRSNAVVGSANAIRSRTILVASKDEAIKKVVTNILSDRDNMILSVSSVKEFFEVLTESNVDFIIYDLDLHPLNNTDAFVIEKVYHPRTPTVVIYDTYDYETTKKLLNKGVIYRMLKPINENDLKLLYEHICRALNGKDVINFPAPAQP